MNIKTKPNGFTLIELMVVVGIIGILSLLVIPNFIGIQRRERVRSAAMEVAQDLRQIRERALAQSGNYTMTFDNAAQPHQYILTSPGGNIRNYLLAGTTGGRIWFGVTGAQNSHPPEGFILPPANNGIDTQAGNRTITLDSRGGVTQSVIYITDGAQNYAVGINPIGKIRIYRNAPGGGWF